MKRVNAIENCLPAAKNNMPCGSTPRSQRLREEVANRYFGLFTETRAANEIFVPSESAGDSSWRQACEHFANVSPAEPKWVRDNSRF